MNRTIFLISAVVVTIYFCAACHQNKQTPPKVIYETNMCLSVDDVGGLAILHALQNRGQADLLAVCYNEIHPEGVAAIDAINTWYGRPDMPIGVYRGAFPDPDTSAFLAALTNFPHDLTHENAPTALEVYRTVLREQPDHSVTIISVGFLNNLSDLVSNERELVAKKVKELVIMGSHVGDDHNLGFHDTLGDARNVLENWPTPIVFHHLGGDIMTGLGLENTPADNPVREAYFEYFNHQFKNYSSWDPMTVLYGVLGETGYFKKNADGKGSHPSGYEWDLKTRNDAVLEALLPAEEYARIIEELLQ